MKTLTVTVVMIALLTGVASSQTGGNANTLADRSDAAKIRAEVAKKKQMELDKAYRDALDKTKAPDATPDPWANVRPAPATKR